MDMLVGIRPTEWILECNPWVVIRVIKAEFTCFVSVFKTLDRHTQPTHRIFLKYEEIIINTYLAASQ